MGTSSPWDRDKGGVPGARASCDNGWGFYWKQCSDQLSCSCRSVKKRKSHRRDHCKKSVSGTDVSCPCIEGSAHSYWCTQRRKKAQTCTCEGLSWISGKQDQFSDMERKCRVWIKSAEGSRLRISRVPVPGGIYGTSGRKRWCGKKNPQEFSR